MTSKLSAVRINEITKILNIILIATCNFYAQTLLESSLELPFDSKSQNTIQMQMKVQSSDWKNT